MISNLALFCLATYLVTFQKIGQFFPNHLVTLKILQNMIKCYSNQGILKYHYTIDLLFNWYGISCMTTGNFCFYLENRLIQTSQTEGQRYSDTSSFSIPCSNICG
jgi:hypothetical protein